MSADPPPAPFGVTALDAPEAQLYGVASPKDRVYWAGLETILAAHPHGQRHILTHWPAYTKRVSLTRFLAHHDLFRRTLEVPGAIVELGVSRGVSFFTWHKLLEIFAPMDTAKKVYGFDSFEGLTDFGEHDGAAQGDDGANDKRPHGWSAGEVEDEIFALAALANADNVVARERSRPGQGAHPGHPGAVPGDDARPAHQPAALRSRPLRAHPVRTGAVMGPRDAGAAS